MVRKAVWLRQCPAGDGTVGFAAPPRYAMAGNAAISCRKALFSANEEGVRFHPAFLTNRVLATVQRQTRRVLKLFQRRAWLPAVRIARLAPRAIRSIRCSVGLIPASAHKSINSSTKVCRKPGGAGPRTALSALGVEA